jgi:hypothetical protein
MRGDAASVISKILSSSVAVSVLFISITLNWPGSTTYNSNLPLFTNKTC